MPREPGADINTHWLERAKRAVAVVDQLGELDEEERVKWYAAGSSPGKAQQAYLLHAGVLALVSIAESLETLAAKARAELEGEQ